MNVELAKILFGLPRAAKVSILILGDFSLCVLTFWLSVALRLETLDLPWANKLFVNLSFFSSATACLIFYVSGVYQGISRFVGLDSFFVVIRAVGIYTTLFATFVLLAEIPTLPRSIGFAHPSLFLLGVAVTRFLVWKVVEGLVRVRSTPSSLPVNTLVYGAGFVGSALVGSLAPYKKWKVIGFIDDDRSLWGGKVLGIQVFPPSELHDLVKTRSVTHLILALPNAGVNRRQEIVEFLTQFELKVLTVPSSPVSSIHSLDIERLQALPVDDLLGRSRVQPDPLLLAKKNVDRVIFVTGAGGSIGSELCRVLLKENPRKLVLIDNSELGLYTVYSELTDILTVRNISTQIIPALTTILNKNGLAALFETYNPNIIYHAAAYKHVDLVEQNICEGCDNNVVGTLNILELARQFEVPDFVLISSDKAVLPSNVMGATKRVAELLCEYMVEESSVTQYSIVRFGNVLGSSGSVIPKFYRQIKLGGPITVTHPEVTRFFMTISEAAELVIQAAALNNKRFGMFVLDMGAPVSIKDLATKIIKLSGYSVGEGIDSISIKFTSLGKGEKLHEQLTVQDHTQATMHPKVFEVVEKNSPNIVNLTLRIKELREAILINDEDLCASVLYEICASFGGIHSNRL